MNMRIKNTIEYISPIVGGITVRRYAALATAYTGVTVP